MQALSEMRRCSDISVLCPEAIVLAPDAYIVDASYGTVEDEGVLHIPRVICLKNIVWLKLPRLLLTHVL